MIHKWEGLSRGGSEKKANKGCGLRFNQMFSRAFTRPSGQKGFSM